MPTRQPVVAGQFYDHRAQTLRQSVEAALAAASSGATQQEAATEQPLAAMIMLPHAGHIYCEAVIAATLTKVTLPSTLFLLGPNHTGAGQGLAVWPEGEWLTPLGPVPVDEELAARLVHSKGGFVHDTAAHAHEHSLEVLLPFLQVLLPDLRIVPVAVGGMDMPALRHAGEALGALQREMAQEGRESALVLSSDMHHFGDHASTCRLDALALNHLMQMDPQGLANTLSRHKISMCGIYPALVCLHACLGDGITQCHLAKHSTSGEVSGDLSRVVGYAGIYATKNILPIMFKRA